MRLVWIKDLKGGARVVWYYTINL